MASPELIWALFKAAKNSGSRIIAKFSDGLTFSFTVVDFCDDGSLPTYTISPDLPPGRSLDDAKLLLDELN